MSRYAAHLIWSGTKISVGTHPHTPMCPTALFE
jgi:hypothetical protein